jgi:predicted phosphoribosyltransferase
MPESIASFFAMPLYRDRRHAGRRLAEVLAPKYQGRSDLVVLALPRGGVPVGWEVAQGLRAPLDVFVVRKLGVPGHEELAMGALASGGIVVLNHDVVDALGIEQETISRVAAAELRELTRREREYRSSMPPAQVEGKCVILVDDGLATGSSMRAAVQALRQRGPRELVVAVPIAAASTCANLRSEVDDAVCAATPEPFRAVGLWYDDFTQTTDQEVHELLARAGEQPGEVL